MKRILFILLSVLIIGCNEKDINPLLIEASLAPDGLQMNNSFTLERTHQLNIPLPQGIPPYFEFADYLVGDSLYYFSYRKHKLAKVDLVSERFDSLTIPKYLINGNIVALCVLNEDSILIAQDNPESLILLKGQNEAELIRLPKINFRTSNEKFFTYSSSLQDYQANFLIDYTNLWYDKKKHSIHIGVQPLNAFDYVGFEESARIAEFDLRTRKWISKYAPPEGMLKYRGDKTYSFEMSAKNMLFNNDTMFVSYSNDHYVYYYHQGKYLGRFPHVSTKSKQMFLPIESSRMNDIEQFKLYTGAAPKYSGFHYHKDLKLYSRLYFDQQESLYTDGRYKPSELYRDVYVIFLDKNFNHVGEYKFPNGSLEYLGAKPLSDGFALFSTSYNDTDSLNTTFKLKHIYKIKPSENS